MLEQIIWLNKNMNVEKNKNVIKRNLLQKGIKQIGHVYKLLEKRLLTASEIAVKYTIHPMTASALLKSIPGI